MLHWQQEFPAIMELLRSQLDGITPPKGFTWIQHYQGDLWKSAREFSVGTMAPALSQSLSLMWGEPKELEKKFGHMSEDEFSALLKDADAELIEEDSYEVLRETFVLWGKLLAFTKNLECVAIHGKTINELVLRGRTQDGALLDAIRIDPALVSHPAFRDKISRAAFEKDETFLAALSSALNPKNRKSRNINTNLNPLRLIIAMMGESGDLEIKPEKLRLFIQQDVGIDYYDGHDPESFRKEVQRLIREYRDK